MNSITEILIIGAGRVGTALFRAVKEKTDILIRIADLKPLEGRLSEKIKPSEYIQINDSRQITLPGLVLIAVPDDKIAKAASWLGGFNLHDIIVIHTSGATPANILSPLKKDTMHIGVFHPLQTFSELFCPSTIWEGIYSTYQGDKEGFAFIQKLAGLFGSKLIQVTVEQKIAIHTAGVLVSNLYFALLNGAEKILDSAGLASSAKNILTPIINQTVNNYYNHSIDEALTGPLKRGDVQTIQRHLQHMENHQGIRKMYIELSIALLNDPDILLKRKTELLELLNDFR